MPDLHTEKGFRAHISNDRHSILAQPIVCAKTNTVLHHEWLVRFDSKTRIEHILRPAELSGAISELDLSMLKQAITVLNIEPNKTPIAVNISGASFSAPAFERAFFASLSHFKANPEKLIFELTETWDLKDLGTALHFFNILRKRGHKLCLDDVGAGAASLRYLRLLPANWLKIDGDFIVGALQNTQERAVLTAVLSLRAPLNVQFIAEGIETQKLLNFAKKMGFDALQGFILGSPKPENY